MKSKKMNCGIIDDEGMGTDAMMRENEQNEQCKYTATLIVYKSPPLRISSRRLGYRVKGVEKYISPR